MNRHSKKTTAQVSIHPQVVSDLATTRMHAHNLATHHTSQTKMYTKHGQPYLKLRKNTIFK